MDGFSRLQPNTNPHVINTKPHSLPHGVLSSYRVMPFGLKNVGTTFQWDMTYVFHDLSHIILIYLDDLTTHSKKRSQHLEDLWIIFQRCRQYNIRLNPLKCVFCITIGCLLGFIISQQGIIVDPLKFQAINEIPPPPPHNLHQLQSLQGKANFLCRFVP
jgi:hypothetical protein